MNEIINKKRRRFFALAKELGYQSEMIKNRGKAHFKKEHFNELTEVELDWLIKKLEKKLYDAEFEQKIAANEADAMRQEEEQGKFAEMEAWDAEQAFYASQGPDY